MIVGLDFLMTVLSILACCLGSCFASWSCFCRWSFFAFVIDLLSLFLYVCAFESGVELGVLVFFGIACVGA